MKFGSPKLWLGLLSAAGVSFFVLGDLGRTSPGPLAAVHARQTELTGIGSCAQCHGGWTATMSESCLDCHEDIHDQIEAHSGLHGTLSTALAKKCAMCHSDHNGDGFAMVNQRSFAVAGFGQMIDFDHARIGFQMEGVHKELECGECHENATVTALPEGGKRFLGLSQDCAKCHEDAHEGRMISSCNSCHGQQSFDQLQATGHDRFLALVGGHANLDCKSCHVPGEAHSLDTLGSSLRRRPRTCAECHESPHDESFVAAIAKVAGKSTGSSCATCHEPQHTSFRSKELTLTAQQHALTGFPLDNPHDRASCADCHEGDADTTFSTRHPGRRADDCRKCHQDPHGGQFDAGPFAKQGCVACHDRQHFVPHAFTLDKHASTQFPLTGKHVGDSAEANCAKCHVDPEPDQARRFAGTPLECAKCHADAHDGFFDLFAGELSSAKNGSCAACHDTEGFGHREKPFDHGRYANFPIKGAHAQMQCEGCHTRTKEPDRTGRTFGRLRDKHGPIRRGGKSCATCHSDPHGGDFDKRGLPTVVDGRSGCERCHTHTSFRALPEKFDHALWTGFELSGAHKSVGCATCHTPMRRPDADGRTWTRAAGNQCADCHADPHGGQFARAARRATRSRTATPAGTDCARCHRPARSFADLTFNHDVHSRFPLGERHKGVACARCHKPARDANEKNGTTEVIRYRPIPRNCVDCHGRQQDPFRRRRGRRK